MRDRNTRSRRRFDDHDAEPETPRRSAPPAWDVTDADAPPDGDRWSTFDQARQGPVPRPPWVVTEHAAVDTELGVLKTGKEADVHLVERAVPGTDRRCLLAAKRYRSAEHRLFHRDAGYLEGRRVRRSRETRAMARRTGYGRELLSGQWADAEFGALATLWSDGVAVPYPVQVHGTELLLEFVGDPDGTAAPRLAQLRPAPDELALLWEQLVEGLRGLARHGLTHGDLSAYNLLVHHGRLVLIDLPQVVSVVANPRGPDYVHRDVARVGAWFTARGLAPEAPDVLLADLLVTLGLV
ncbi:serine protein kinase RIO [Pseudonocardia sp.]|uniref:serine protein kinase RIO n=1 Tax=Pseudonocardia sp. TaxID=60912 RepID=UPI003D0A10C8